MVVRVRVPLAARLIIIYCIMRNHFVLTLSVCSIVALSSCSSKLGKLSADNFTVDPNPLETLGGQVPATINGNFPVKYMKPKAVVTVIPELRYGNGQVAQGKGATFQGEKVMGNDQTISYKMGGRYTMKTAFDYVPDMQKSEMYLTFDARVGKKKVEVPAVKVANGVLATAELYKQTLMNAGGCIAPDSFERVKAQKYEANIKFLINQANLRKSELKNNSVKEFLAMLKKINADREGLNLKNVEVQAYASPDGGYSFNDKLANKRQNTTEGYVKKQVKAAKLNTKDIDAHYTAQDWDGFKRLVQAFRELADGILPELRRSRMIINYETIGRSDEQIKQQYAADPARLSADELLYAATLESDPAKKEAIYKKTAELYDKDYRAYNNLAALAFNKGDESTAKQYIEQAKAKRADAPEANANLALIDMKHGNLNDATNHLADAIDANGFYEVLGNLNIAKGNYATDVKNADAMTDYLMALVLNRQGNTATAKDYLQRACKKDAKLAAYAANDLELANLK